jgi:hypothetical protein
MVETFNRYKSLLAVPPYVGFNFKDVPSSDNGLSCIYTPDYDAPEFHSAITKMRGNYYCLKNPKTFDSAKVGEFHYNDGNTFYLKKTGSGPLGPILTSKQTFASKRKRRSMDPRMLPGHMDTDHVQMGHCEPENNAEAQEDSLRKDYQADQQEPVKLNQSLR